MTQPIPTTSSPTTPVPRTPGSSLLRLSHGRLRRAPPGDVPLPCPQRRRPSARACGPQGPECSDWPWRAAGASLGHSPQMLRGGLVGGGRTVVVSGVCVCMRVMVEELEGMRHPCTLFQRHRPCICAVSSGI